MTLAQALVEHAHERVGLVGVGGLVQHLLEEAFRLQEIAPVRARFTGLKSTTGCVSSTTTAGGPPRVLWCP